jgi:2-polyprenyl-3-methyl-5-hydroxy-6-metoxy-1,4-benzoquinol methylase
MSHSCPLCDEDAPDVFHPHVWKGNGQRVMRCPHCEAFFVDPQLSQEEQKQFDADYHQYIETRAAVVLQHDERTFDDHVDESIAERLTDIGRWFQQGLSILEVGAEKGGFLDLVAPTADRIAAVDSCPEYVTILAQKGYAAYRYIEDVPPTEKYQRICLFSLLEHIAKPQEFLREIKWRMAEDGYLIIEVPLAKEPLIALYDIADFKSFYFQAMHPYVYSEKAAKAVLERAGFVVEQIQYKQRYGLANHLQWLTAGIPGGNKQFEQLFGGKTDEAYKKALENAGHTDTMYIFARAALEGRAI